MTNQQKAMLQTAKIVGIILLCTSGLLVYNYLVSPTVFGLTIALSVAVYCIWVMYTINLSKIESDEKYQNRSLR